MPNIYDRIKKTLTKQDEKKDKKLTTPLLSQQQNRQTSRRIESAQISQFDMIWGNFLTAIQNIDKEPFEFLCATVVLRFALEKELGKTHSTVTADDIQKFLKELQCGELEINLTNAQERSLQLLDFGRRDSVMLNPIVGSSGALLPQVIGTLAAKTSKIGLPSDKQERNKPQEDNPELWLKFRIYIDAFKIHYEKTGDYINAYMQSIIVANEFFNAYKKYKQEGNTDLDATYLAEAKIKRIKNVNDYVHARKEEKLSLELSVIYAQAITQKDIQYPVLYARFIGQGENHDEALRQSILLGDKKVNTDGFDSYIRNMGSGEKSETYSVAYAVAFGGNYKKPGIYAEEIEKGKSETYAKAYAEAIASKLSPLHAEMYAEKIDEGKSHQQATFNAVPTFENWFNLHRGRNIAISITGIGFMILLCVGNIKVHVQENVISDRASTSELKEKTAQRVPQSGSSSSSTAKEEEGQPQSYNKNPEQPQINERDYQRLRNNNNNNNQTKEVDANQFISSSSSIKNYPG